MLGGVVGFAHIQSAAIHSIHLDHFAFDLSHQSLRNTKSAVLSAHCHGSNCSAFLIIVIANSLHLMK